MSRSERTSYNGSYRAPKNEREELVFYKGLFLLNESSKREDKANDELIAIYREQCKYVALIRPYMGWEGIARAMGISSQVLKTRYKSYAEDPQSFEEDENAEG